MITPRDADRLARLADAWTTALAQAQEAGEANSVASLGTLTQPNAAVPNPAPPPGRYRCRTIKMGGQQELLDFLMYSWFDCEIETDTDGTFTLTKLTGSQRQVGTLYPDTDLRMVFLGGLALGTETDTPAYGADPERDVVGILEKVGPIRWRLVQPWPYYESNLDLLELLPAQR